MKIAHPITNNMKQLILIFLFFLIETSLFPQNATSVKSSVKSTVLGQTKTTYTYAIGKLITPIYEIKNSKAGDIILLLDTSDKKTVEVYYLGRKGNRHKKNIGLLIKVPIEKTSFNENIDFTKNKINITDVLIPKENKKWINLGKGYAFIDVIDDENKIKWKGGRKDTLANGEGQIIWYYKGIPIKIFKGNLEDGLYSGKGEIDIILNKNYDKTISLFEGEFINGEFKKGNGTVITKNGNIFFGEWNNSQPINGIEYLKDGGKYLGEFKNRKYDGIGELFYANRDYYKGDWKEGLYHGKGNFISTNGIKYTGGWKNGLKDGYGYLNYKDGSTYNGYWKDGNRNGEGTYNDAEGWKYVGKWDNDMRNGYGKKTYKDGSIFEGEWVNNYRRKGKYTSINGDLYDGEFENGSKNGKGTLYFINGNIYSGEFKNDKMDGYGTLTLKNGNKYNGSFKEDRKNGHGILVKNDSTKFIGNWKDNDMDGEFEIINPDNTLFKGLYVDDKLINGTGKLILDSLVFTGTISNSLPFNGKGQFHYFDNGYIIEGDWINGKLCKGKITYTEIVKARFLLLPPKIEKKIKISDNYYYTAGTIYKGEINNLLPNGQGEIIAPNGIYVNDEFFPDINYKGVFNNGEFYAGVEKIAADKVNNVYDLVKFSETYKKSKYIDILIEKLYKEWTVDNIVYAINNLPSSPKTTILKKEYIKKQNGFYELKAAAEKYPDCFSYADNIAFSEIEDYNSCIDYLYNFPKGNNVSAANAKLTQYKKEYIKKQNGFYELKAAAEKYPDCFSYADNIAFSKVNDYSSCNDYLYCFPKGNNVGAAKYKLSQYKKIEFKNSLAAADSYILNNSFNDAKSSLETASDCSNGSKEDEKKYNDVLNRYTVALAGYNSRQKVVYNQNSNNNTSSSCSLSLGQSVSRSFTYESRQCSWLFLTKKTYTQTFYGVVDQISGSQAKITITRKTNTCDEPSRSIRNQSLYVGASIWDDCSNW